MFTKLILILLILLRIPLTNEMMRKLRVRYNIGSLLVISNMLWSAMCAAVFCGVLWYFAHGDDVFRPWSLFMILWTSIWGPSLAANLYYNLLLFHVTCYMFGMRLDKVNKNLFNFIFIILINLLK